VLPFADHADFDELVRLATESGAQRVITMHGPKKFARLLCEMGLNAEHLAEHPGGANSKKPPPKKARVAVEQKLFD